MKSFAVAFVVLCCFSCGVLARPQRQPLTATPIENGKVYRLENQEDGAFLSANDNGQVAGGEYVSRPGQKWLFKETAPETYRIVPTGSENNPIAQIDFQVIRVSHGKRLFKNTQTGLCLQNFGRGRPVQERECGRDTPRQRWNVQTVAY